MRCYGVILATLNYQGQHTNATHPLKHNNQAIYLETSIVIQSVLMSRVSLLQRVSCGCMVIEKLTLKRER